MGFFWRIRSRDEDGVAMVTVMLASITLLSLAIATVGYGIGSRTLSRHDQDWNAALAGAEAGIDDYIHRLNENANYWQYSATTPPPDGNNAFTAYVPVPGNANPSTYRYTADASRLKIDGTIKLASTGKVNNVKRTVLSTLRRRTFIDYLYFTDFETLDPAMYTGTPFTPAQAQVQCAKYYYAGRNASCTNISFISVDNINGPLHSNDSLLLCGTPHFNGDSSTSWNTAAPRYRDGCPTSAPVFATPGDPKYLVPLTMPPSNAAIKAETVPLSGPTGGGCLYTGPTRITLNSNATMTVDSKFSKNTNNGCPTNGTGPLPVNGVIYVQNVPATVTDPNYTAGCPYNVRFSPSDPLRNHPLGYPIANDITTYACRNGDAFVSGTLKGQLTIAGENNIDVTWHLQYQGGIAGTDLLGLIANNNVEIYHPVDSSGNNLNVNGSSKFQNPVVQAAILSLSHSFRVQNWGSGAPLGTINLTGAIAQRYRGPVGMFTGGSPPVVVYGYAKGYVYDQRLKYLSPPKFLDPVASAWGVAVWIEEHNPPGV